MKIKEYLRLLKSSTVKELESFLLMQDNFPFVLKTNVSILVKDVLPAHQFTYLRRYVPHPQKETPKTKEDQYIYLFEHMTGTHTQIIPWIAADFPNVWQDIDFNPYNITATFHFNQKDITRKSRLHYLQAGVRTTINLVQAAIKNNIPFCLPFTFYSSETDGLVRYGG